MTRPSTSSAKASADRPDPRSAPDPRSREVQQRRISRIPAFTPVPVRPRADGWLPWRQCEFLGFLAETKSVKRAAEKVGMSRESAYRLRGRRGAEEFARAWDAILGAVPRPLPKVTLDLVFRRIVEGNWRPVMRAGRYAGSLHRADNSALRSALGRSDWLAEDGGRKGKGHRRKKGRSVSS